MTSQEKSITDRLKSHYAHLQKVKLKAFPAGDPSGDGFVVQGQQILEAQVYDGPTLWRMDHDRVIKSVISMYNRKYGARVFSLKSGPARFKTIFSEIMSGWYTAQMTYTTGDVETIYCRIPPHSAT